MPVDQKIRRLAADPEVVAVIKYIDCFFYRLVADANPALSGKTPAERVEDYWLMIKQGVLRLYDPEVDDDDGPLILKAETPRQCARARAMGTKLFTVRQHIRRLQNAKTGHLPIQRAKGFPGTPTPHRAKISRNIL